MNQVRNDKVLPLCRISVSKFDVETLNVVLYSAVPSKY